MPFTVSHAAAVLPLRRTRLPWSALVIGSFGPDFQYFVRMNYDSRSWHHYPDVLTFCLPFALLSYLLFHGFIKRPAAGLLPPSIHRRVDLDAPWLPKNLADAFLLVLALAIGIFTHMVWDACTHAFTWPWRHFPFLRRELLPGHHPHIYVFNVAQALSTVIGLVILGIAFQAWYRRTPPEHPAATNLTLVQKFAFFFTVTALAAMVAVLRTNSVLGEPRSRFLGPTYRGMLVICGIAWFLWELLAYGVMVTFWQGRRQN